MAVFNYIMRKVWLQQTRIGLSLYDAIGQGLLTEMVKNTSRFYCFCLCFTKFLLIGFRELHYWAHPYTASTGGSWKVFSFILCMHSSQKVSLFPRSA